MDLKVIPSRMLRLLFPFFIGTGFPPFYRVIDPIARGKYAVSIMLMGQFQSAFTANLESFEYQGIVKRYFLEPSMILYHTKFKLQCLFHIFGFAQKKSYLELGGPNHQTISFYRTITELIITCVFHRFLNCWEVI